MKIWLVGAKGMLGQEILSVLKTQDCEVLATDREVDITRRKAVNDFAVANSDIDFIINCAAYTNVDGAEDNAGDADLLNNEAVKLLVRAAMKIDAKLIQISTDYVFRGEDDILLTEDMKPYPPSLSIYGQTKFLGEKAIVTSKLDEYFIVRTSWLYGKNGKNFVDTMLRLMNEKSEIGVVSDQWGTPTYTNDLAIALSTIVFSGNTNYGVYHYSGMGKTNWYLFACKIYEIGKELGLITNDCTINPLTTEQYPTRARRPKFSVLSKEKIMKEFGIKIAPWEESLREYLTEKAKNQ